MSNAFLNPKHFYWLSDAIVIYITLYSPPPPPKKKGNLLKIIEAFYAEM